MTNGLKVLRERSGLTQQDAANALHMSRSGYIKIEGSYRKLSQKHIVNAMRVFGATESQVLNEQAAALAAGTAGPDPVKSAMTEKTEAARRMGLARFLGQLSDPAGALDWLDIVEDLEEAFRPPADGAQEPLDLDRIRERADLLADRAKRKLRQYREKQA